MAWLAALALLLTPSMAHADPFTAALVAFLGEGGFILAMSTLKTVFYAGMVVNGVTSARRQRRAARAAYESSLRDRAVVVRSADLPRTIVYGRTRVSGPLVYAASSGPHKEHLHLVIALAGHELDAIEDVWFNDEPLGALDVNGWVTGGRYVKSEQKSSAGVSMSLPGNRQIVLDHTPDTVYSVAVDTGTDNGYETVAYTITGNVVTVTDPAHVGKWVTATYSYTEVTPLVRVQRFLGTAVGERDTDLEAAAAGEWTPAHLGKGVPRLHVTLVYDPDTFPSGIPNISAVVRGKKVYDPRTMTTAWSRNAALIARDYLTSELGFSEDPAAINSALLVTAANICDELVPGYEIVAGVKTSVNLPRYTVDGVLGTDADRVENLGMILGAMVGTAAYSGDQWLVRAGAYVTPALDLTADDLGSGSIELVSALPRRELFNAVTGRFIDPAQGYQATDFPPYFSSTYASLDGGEELARDVVLPLTNNASVAQRIAKLVLHRARQALTISATWKLKAYPLQPGDTCRLTVEYFGWSNKVFRVVERRLKQPGLVDLVLQEEAAAVYAWNFNEDLTPDPAPNTSLPGPGAVAALVTVVLSSGAPLYRRLADGTQQPIIRATWDAVTDIAVRQGGVIEIWVKRANEPEPTPYMRLPGDATGTDIAPVARDETYLVQLRAVNALGVHGPWTMISHTVSSGAVVNTAGPQVSQIYLTATSTIFHVDAGGSPTPSSISVTLETPDPGAPISWSIVTGSATLGGSGLTRTLAYVDAASDIVTIMAEQGPQKALLTIVKVYDGAPGGDGNDGDDGDDGKSIALAATSQVFLVSKTGSATPTSITFTLTAQNLIGAATWSATNSANLSGSGSTRTLTYGNMPGESTTVSVSQGGYSDHITVVKVRDGSDAVVSLLTNESHVVPAASDGSGPNLSGAVTYTKIFVGASDDTANWSFSRVNGPGVTSTLTTSGGNIGMLTVTGLSVDASYVDITATRAGYSTQTKRFTISKAKAGSPGNPGERGSLTGYGANYGIVSGSWSDGIANRVINNMLTGQTLTSSLASTAHLRIGDTVTLSNTTNFAQSRYWSGFGWVNPGVVLDGNLLVQGTISGNKIAALAISADKMAANSITAANGAIADLTVGTLKVINNAITLPLSAAGGSQILDFNYLNLCSVGATMSGSNVFIMGQVYVYRPSAPNPTEIEIKLRDTNGTLKEVRVEMPGTAGPRIAPVIMYVGAVANAFRTFYLDARLVGAAGGTVLQSSLFVIETKK